jgi:hypothetical protein
MVVGEGLKPSPTKTSAKGTLMTPNDHQSTIEQAFLLSWDGIERFYTSILNRHGWEYMAWLKPILDLISELSSRGYDRKLRAGQSVATFIVSRSRKDGLRQEQACLRIELNGKGGTWVDYHEHPDNRIQFEQDRVELTPELEALLERLAAQPVD